jgi:hypothetical protein
MRLVDIDVKAKEAGIATEDVASNVSKQSVNNNNNNGGVSQREKIMREKRIQE